MCGIFGLIKNTSISEDDLQIAKESISIISHRGPDALGIKTFDNLIFAHCRLAIIDLNSRSNQPLIDSDNGNLIIFNGEIYNNKEIKEELILKGINFSTESDTEVILKSFNFYGLNCFKKFRGMFTIIIYCPRKDKIYFARDCAGEKPLYYFYNNGEFIYSSEIKPILYFKKNKLNLNKKELSFFLKTGHSFENKTILSDIYQIKPGSINEYDLNSNTFLEVNNFDMRVYLQKNEKCIDTLIDDIYLLIKSSLREQLVADVPTGLLLSGGLDSSLLTIIAAESFRDINAFSVRFANDINIKDIDFAKEITSTYSINHIIIDSHKPKLNEVISFLENLDYPTGDPSCLPTYLLCNSVKNYCKVAIGGDGADEVFGGYKHINRSINIAKKKKFVNRRIGTLILKIMLKFELINKNQFSQSKLILENKIPLFPNFFSNEEIEDFIGINLPLVKSDIGKWNESNELHLELLMNDFKNFLPNDILHKSDRVSMLSSLELRSPYLDNRIIKLILSHYPYLIKGGFLKDKYLLKKIAMKKLSLDFFQQKKLGFLPQITEFFVNNNDREIIYEYLINNNYFELNNDKLFIKIKEASYSIRKAFQIFELLSLTAWLRKNNEKINLDSLKFKQITKL